MKNQSDVEWSRYARKQICWGLLGFSLAVICFLSGLGSFALEEVTGLGIVRNIIQLLFGAVWLTHGLLCFDNAWPWISRRLQEWCD